MADQVQATLDRMVPALRDLLDRGIFTETEIKAIVSRRRESEYLLHRVAPRKSDYQRYIEAERNLEKLRVLRKKMVFARYEAKEREKQENGDTNDGYEDKNDKGKSNAKPKSSFGDNSIIQNIHLLFVRAKRKWKDDLAWHLAHAEFAKEAKSYQMLSRIYAEALQIHPRNESLWVEAASHEYFGYMNADEKDQDIAGGGSIKSARVLLQRGLRINSQAKNLWIQSFCLELHYIQKLRGRREILSLQNKSDDGGDSDGAELDDSLKLPHIIYKNAVKSLPMDVSFRMQFVEQCKLFPKTAALIKFIMKSIEEDFENNEAAWIARAQYIVDSENSNVVNKGFLLSHKPFNEDSPDNSAKKRKRESIGGYAAIDEKVLQTLNEAVSIVQTPKMYEESLIFLRRYISNLGNLDDEVGEKEIKKRMTTLINAVINQINTAESEISITPELAIQMSTILHEIGLSTQSLQLIKRLTSENSQCSKCADCWLKIVEISENVNIDEGEEKVISASNKLLRKALKIIPMYEAGYIQILAELFTNLLISSKGNKDDKLFTTFEKILLLYKQNEQQKISLPSIALAYLRYAVDDKKDMKLVRKVYQKFLFNSNCCENFSMGEEDAITMKVYFDECIESELNHMKINAGTNTTSQQKQRMNNLYSAASKHFENFDDKLAHSYLQMRSEQRF